jgi:hypothetical protein
MKNSNYISSTISVNINGNKGVFGTVPDSLMKYFWFLLFNTVPTNSTQNQKRFINPNGA